jgi:hypothetical protein
MTFSVFLPVTSTCFVASAVTFGFVGGFVDGFVAGFVDGFVGGFVGGFVSVVSVVCAVRLLMASENFIFVYSLIIFDETTITKAKKSRKFSLSRHFLL